MTKFNIQRLKRDKRVIELYCMGLTQRQTSDRMREEGFRISPRTVETVLHGKTAAEEAEEIKRRQLQDIAIADPALRLKWRAHLLDRLMPHRIEQKTEGKQSIVLEIYRPGQDDAKPKPEDEDSVLP